MLQRVLSCATKRAAYRVSAAVAVLSLVPSATAAEGVGSEPGRRPQVELAASAFSTNTATPLVQSSAEFGDVDALKLDAAEVLSIRVHGYANLSGEYRVNAEHVISVPVFGRVSVKGRDASDLEKELSSRVTSLTGAVGYATVEVARYRPVLVSGAVAKPGSFPWSPGMRVAHAEALSGGPARERLPDALVGINMRSQMERAEADVKQTVVTLARLRAERHGKDKVELPKEVMFLFSRAEGQAMIDTQQAILTSSLAAYTAQLSNLRQATITAREELAALESGVQFADNQISSRKTRASELKGLESKGLLSRERSLDNEEKIAGLQEKRTTSIVAIAKLRGNLLALDQDLIKLAMVRSATLDKEIWTLERELQRFQIEIEGARAAQRLSDPAPEGAAIARKVTYTVMRQVVDGFNRIAADPMTELRPGDIVVVNDTAGPPRGSEGLAALGARKTGQGR